MAEQYIDKTSLKVIHEKLRKLSNEKITLEDIMDKTEFSYSQVYKIVIRDNYISVSGISFAN